MVDCPDNQTLNRLLTSGLTPEREQWLSDHLDHCAACRERLERAAAGDRTMKDIARNLRGTGELSDSVKRVIEKCSSDPAILIRTGGGQPRDDEFLVDSRPECGDRTHAATTQVPGKEVRFAAGDRLGSYEILAEIGRGGMGTVYKARDLDHERLVAIKVLHSHVDSMARRRFLREARAVAAIEHRNVVKMYGVEELPVPYMVMEYIDGPSLRDYLAGNGTLDLRTILRIGLQIASALEASHAGGVTHRDIKPANLVLDIATGLVKLTDFGLAHIEGDAKLTMEGFVTGTPAYMSPEQVLGKKVDHRSDLFSLGSVLYAMSTGQSPFDDERTLATMDRVCSAVPDAPQSINPRIPTALSDLIRWLHSKRASKRPCSAAEVVRILRQQLDELNQAPSDTSDGGFTRATVGRPQSGSPSEATPDAGRQQDAGGRGRLRYGATAVIVAAVAGLALLVWLGRMLWPAT